MSIAVALLSGKGGSGKTTLALSMADLLCRCEVRTLLVDCDLSTNGATFFYESQLLEWNKDKPDCISSFSDILLNRKGLFVEPIPLKIKNRLDFIPSIVETSDQNFKVESVQNSMTAEHSLSWLLNWARRNYDVILFDCQAGYSEFLPSMLPMMDADLFVLEADSISASAMRSLHLKIGNHFGHARLYQVFNKATPEEFKIYSKIVGTFFTNIGTLLFDWKIRQAFSRSQIPDMENTSAQYGLDLCNICKIIFSGETVQKKLHLFSSRLHYRNLENKREEIDKKLDELIERRSLSAWKLCIPVLFLLVSTIFIAWFVLFNEKTSVMHSSIKAILIPFVSILIGIISAAFAIWPIRNGEQRERMEYEQTLKKIDRELAKLGKELEQSVPLQQDNVGKQCSL